MSKTGTATGRPATLASFVRRKLPPAHSATSVEVPPMSNVMISSNPAALAACVAPTTPPAGPERIVRTGSSDAARAEMLPPDDCITRKPRADTWPPSRFRYAPIKGCRYAFIATVEVRSYSRYSGRIL